MTNFQLLQKLARDIVRQARNWSCRSVLFFPQ